MAYKTKLHDVIIMSTLELGNALGFSQQTASRKIKELEEKGFLNKELVAEGMKLSLTLEAKQLLEQNYITLKSLFGTALKQWTGKVISGLGEGRYYVQIEGYQKQFKEKLNLTPYPGTLNIEVNPVELKEFFQTKNQIIIEGFVTKERTFGGILCYPIKINKKLPGYLIKPLRSTHTENIIEIIAPVYLRGEFELEDGSEIIIE
ncbi:CTP-dependent riboflavin kinase [Candidatus Woesearchaeota archaeon]|nr:CTP-dependent riboflavin kinase [Candidatus Woesearchaeota archaeon]